MISSGGALILLPIILRDSKRIEQIKWKASLNLFWKSTIFYWKKCWGTWFISYSHSDHGGCSVKEVIPSLYAILMIVLHGRYRDAGRCICNIGEVNLAFNLSRLFMIAIIFFPEWVLPQISIFTKKMNGVGWLFKRLKIQQSSSRAIT